MAQTDSLSVAIPTYRRERVLLETLEQLFRLEPEPREILVIDQTAEHEAATREALSAWDSEARIRWLRLSKASQPHALNQALLAATGDILLFLDDDIVPDKDLFSAHLSAQRKADLVAGMVLQPGETESSPTPGGRLRFTSNEPAWIGDVMSGNCSIKRKIALAMGGFDENFVGAAYRFDAEFAHRYCVLYGKILYAPSARIWHLQAPAGGTRAHGHHLRTARPGHSVGEYYYLLCARPKGWLVRFVMRPLRSIRTRYHLRRPWRIPLSLVAELRGMTLALRLRLQGPRYIRSKS